MANKAKFFNTRNKYKMLKQNRLQRYLSAYLKTGVPYSMALMSAIEATKPAKA